MSNFVAIQPQRACYFGGGRKSDPKGVYYALRSPSKNMRANRRSLEIIFGPELLAYMHWKFGDKISLKYDKVSRTMNMERTNGTGTGYTLCYANGTKKKRPSSTRAKIAATVTEGVGLPEIRHTTRVTETAHGDVLSVRLPNGVPTF